jgi:hypothetical protein
MPEQKATTASMVVVGVVVLLAIATVALIGNFTEATFGDMWPVLAMAVGGALVAFGFMELGLGLIGVFGILLLANLEVIPTFGKSWPFTLIWIAAVVVIGFLRARARSQGSA